ncbi:hypothetical protein PQR67_22945 [Paraburkholderia fungorum]|uniref:hypothetical protein n=1 Tax=Paraburkholderia fungorum TaxID=134537 RepID=UPI0038B77077
MASQRGDDIVQGMGAESAEKAGEEAKERFIMVIFHCDIKIRQELPQPGKTGLATDLASSFAWARLALLMVFAA